MTITAADPLLLLAAFGAALLASAGNAVAGGGTNLSFPVLVWLGLPPVVANATSGVGLWPGHAGASWSYRSRRGPGEGRWWWLAVPSLAGGALGAWLLLALPPDWFGAVAPWLVIGASGLIAVEPLVRRWVSSPGRREGRWAGPVATQFGIAVYGGYFGAGAGILLLVALGLMGMHDLHVANAWKNVLAVAMKSVAVVWFAIAGIVVWPVALVMALGSILGGYATGRAIQGFDQAKLRWMVVGFGAAMGVLLLLTGTG